MLYTRIPLDRVGVLIGPEGETKSRLQERTGVALWVDSTTGEVTIDESRASDPSEALKVRDVVTAIGRGFSENRAFRLLADEVYLSVLDIKEHVGKSKVRVAQLRARVIGKRGRTRELLEQLTDCNVSVHGHTVAIIGEVFHLQVARDAVEMLLRGSEHRTVYRFLERKRVAIRAYELGL